MFKMPEKIIYALPEIIGNTDLFVGRKKEFNYFFGVWFQDLTKNFAQNQAIISRRKKGKTAFLQRLFNIFWSAYQEDKKESITVIPFYYSIHDTPVKLGAFAEDFYTQFIKCYLSCTRREPELLTSEYDLFQLEQYMDDAYIKKTYEAFEKSRKEDNWEKMWQLASRLPASVARLKKIKILQIIDEFQNINGFIYNQRGETIHQMSGTYMQVAEFREAPMIVSGSEVHWLLRIVSSLTGRFQVYNLENLPENEAKEAIERYATFRNTKIDEEAKENIWRLTEGDPLYIKALFLSRFNQAKDYTVDDNIVDVYEKEISEGEIYTTWMEYMLNTFTTVNKTNSKRIMLYLLNQRKEKTRAEIIKDLKLPYTDQEAEEKLNALIAGDLISQGHSAYDYTITRDKTYELVFRRIYQKEIDHFVPDIKGEIRKVLGKDNYQKGKFTEFLLKERLKKSFNLNEITETGETLKIIPIDIEERKLIPTGVGKSEIDLFIRAKNGYEVYIDIKNTKSRYGKKETDRWLKIADYLRKDKTKALFLVYSENGYTKGTQERLEKNDIQVIKGSEING